MSQSLLKTLKKLIPATPEGDEAIQEVQKVVQELSRTKLHLQLLEKAIQADYDSIIITEVDMETPGPRIVYVNDGFTRMTGYTREEAIGQTPRILQGEKTDRNVLHTLRERLVQGKSFFGHTVNYRKDGSEFINQWDIHPLFNENNELAYWVSYQHDITERKRSELTTLDADQEFDDLTEESKKISLDLDMAGNVLSANKLFRDLSGYHADQLKTLKIWDILKDVSGISVQDEFSSAKPFAEKRTVSLITSSDSEIEAEVVGKVMKTPDQDVVRLSLENKAAQNRIMEALRSRSGSMQSLFEPVSFFDYRFKVEGDHCSVDYVAESLEKVLGRASSGLRTVTSGHGFKEKVRSKDQAEYEAFLQRVLSGQSATQVYQFEFSQGQLVRVVDYAKPIQDDQTGHIVKIKGRISTEVSSS